MGLPVDECRKYHNDLCQFLYLYGLCYVFLVVDELPDIPDLVDDVLSAGIVLSLLGDVGAQLMKDCSDLERIQPFLEEAGVFTLEGGQSGTRMC